MAGCPPADSLLCHPPPSSPHHFSYLFIHICSISFIAETFFLLSLLLLEANANAGSNQNYQNEALSIQVTKGGDCDRVRGEGSPRLDRMLGFFSRPNWDPPLPQSAAGECVPSPHPLVPGGHARLWGPNSNEGTHTVELYIYIGTLWDQ
jgi:hypothetical protein